jgi:CRISPR/Cas system CSM-associated protein Csm3 (group 7 of RAMP superfamily)
MRYKVQFFDFWHLSSGASAGTALDNVVVKDENGLPYIPGKTIKGLIREMASVLNPSKVKRVFGDEGSAMADTYFSDATLDEDTKNHLIKNPNLIKHLYDKVTSTKIDEKGLAEDKTLRDTEVVVPLTLSGEIECNDEKLIADAMAMIKQMGLNRNRGLGRCLVSEVKDGN